VEGLKGIKLEWGCWKAGKQAKEKWVIEKRDVESPSLALQACIDKREVKGSIRLELRMREVDKGGDSLINKGGTAKFTKARLGSLRRAHR